MDKIITSILVAGTHEHIYDNHAQKNIIFLLLRIIKINIIPITAVDAK